MTNLVSIYGLCDPITGEIRYVGKSTSPKARLAGHISEGKVGTRTAVARWIFSILPLKPRLTILATCSEVYGYNLEVAVIELCRQSGDRLTNVTIGGQGNNGVAMSETTRRKIADAHRGKTLSVETKTKMSRSRKGKKHSPEWAEKIANSHRGRKRSLESRARMSAANKAWRTRKKRAAYTAVGPEQIAALGL